MKPAKNQSTLNTTKSDTFRFTPPFSLLRESITSISSKYSTSESYYLLNSINQVVQSKKSFNSDKKCKLRWFIKDMEFNREGENLQKYVNKQESEKQLPELTEYYKYYTQTSILYQSNFYKLMHQYRQKKKVVQYNRLKILLNLSDSAEKSDAYQEKNKKNSTPLSSFYILSKLSVTSKIEDEQSQIVKKLNVRLQRTLGPNCYRTVEELDRNYHFQKKIVDSSPFIEIRGFKKMKYTQQQKENLKTQTKNGNIKQHKPNNSCDFRVTPSYQAFTVNQKLVKKKKNFSMDNLSNIMKDYQGKSNKQKMCRHDMKELRKSSKCNSSKTREKFFEDTLKLEEKEKNQNIKWRIEDVRQKIRKQKQKLKKKITETTNQSDLTKSHKKIASIMMQSRQKNMNKKIIKIQNL